MVLSPPVRLTSACPMVLLRPAAGLSTCLELPFRIRGLFPRAGVSRSLLCGPSFWNFSGSFSRPNYVAALARCPTCLFPTLPSVLSGRVACDIFSSTQGTAFAQLFLLQRSTLFSGFSFLLFWIPLDFAFSRLSVTLTYRWERVDDRWGDSSSDPLRRAWCRRVTDPFPPFLFLGSDPQDVSPEMASYSYSSRFFSRPSSSSP